MSEKLAVIDLELGARLAGNDRTMAEELITMLLEALPEHQAEITEAYEANHLENLRQATHKLHGATCYTGTPSLKQASANLEQAAKQRAPQEAIDQYYQAFLKEVKALQSQSLSI